MARIDNMILVVGMHRSGTSAAARLINILGADVGENLLLGQTEINRNGFWENNALIDIHDEIFVELDSAWFDFRPLPPEWWRSEEIRPFGREILSVVERDYSSTHLLGVKDPRLCRFLPLWKEVLKPVVQNTLCLLMIRNPLEVAGSLKKRDNIEKDIALMLWMLYVLEAEYYSRELRRSVVDYDGLLKDWKGTVERMTDELGITWPKSIPEVADALQKEINPDLRRHHLKPLDLKETDALTRKALAVYAAVTGGDLSGSRDFFDDTRERLHEFELISGAMPDIVFREKMNLVEKTNALMQLGKEHQHAMQVVEERDQQLEHLHEERDRQVRQLIKERDQALAVLNRIQSHWIWRISYSVYRMFKRS